ncbi:unnamed protein product [Mycena citricolor]|uniref:RING-type domain-containing protein n=1 Tax=Mycena citricolor TaxID=2018698 RepID=A0AAD2Q3H7_9AGAR|nr:unnamed protein product [Mycena citricolor]
MGTCTVCAAPFTSPVSLPCGASRPSRRLSMSPLIRSAGHIFCRACCLRNLGGGDGTGSEKAIRPCPRCRAAYSAESIDPVVILPSASTDLPCSVETPGTIPAASMSDTTPSSFPSSPSSSSSSSTLTPGSSTCHADRERLQSELAALRLTCSTWQRRAEMHASANHSLLGFARAAKECAVRLRSERDSARTRCELLKRKLADVIPEYSIVPATDEAEIDRRTARRAPCGLPVFLAQCRAKSAPGPPDVNMSESLFGPPFKRRRSGAAPCFSDEGSSSSSSSTAGSAPGSTVSGSTPPTSPASSAASETDARCDTSPEILSVLPPIVSSSLQTLCEVAVTHHRLLGDDNVLKRRRPS